MDHQDFREIIIRGKPKQISNKKIVSRGNNIDLHKIKIENEQENFKIAIAGCLFGIISYGFLIGSVLSVVALALLLIDYQKFNNK